MDAMSAKDPVLLGFIDLPIPVTDNCNFQVNKIGGIPDWMSKEEAVCCRLCSRESSLVCQIYCPLGQSTSHRTLYLFCCVNHHCWNKSDSWTALRCQQEVEACTGSESRATDEKSTSSSTWLSNQDDWDLDVDPCPEPAPADGLCSATENLALPPSPPPPPPHPSTVQGSETAMDDDSNESDSSASQVIPEHLPAKFVGDFPWKTNMPRTQVFTKKIVFSPFYVSVSEESSYEMDSLEHADNLLQDYQQHAGNPFYKVKNSSSVDEGSHGKESYEKSDVKHGDKCFYRFQKKLAKLPQQIVRYQWGGSPLLVYPHEEPLLPCPSCGSRRVFEFQLMPTLIPSLKIQDHEANGNDPPVEFGTVIVSSCVSSCWTGKDVVKYEHVLVQSDPDEKLFQVQ